MKSKYGLSYEIEGVSAKESWSERAVANGLPHNQERPQECMILLLEDFWASGPATSATKIQGGRN